MLTLDGRIIINKDEQPDKIVKPTRKEPKQDDHRFEKTSEVDISKTTSKEKTEEVDISSISKTSNDNIQNIKSDLGNNSSKPEIEDTNELSSNELSEKALNTEESNASDTLSFLDILQGGTKVTETTNEEKNNEAALLEDPEEDTDTQSPGFDAVDDLLEQEISSSFSDNSSSVFVEEDEAVIEVENSVNGTADKEKKIGKNESDHVLPEIDLASSEDTENGAKKDQGFHDETLEMLSTNMSDDKSGDDYESSALVEVTDNSSDNFNNTSAFVEENNDDTGIFIELFSASSDAGPDETDMLPMFSDPQDVFIKKRKSISNSNKHPDAVSPEETRNQLKEKEGLLIEGLRYYKRKEFEQAIVKFTDAVKKYPNFKEAHSILGNAFFRTGQLEEAMKAYFNVIKMDSTDATARENIGVIYANRGEYSQAVDQWKKILKHDPSRADIKLKINEALDLIGHK